MLTVSCGSHRRCWVHTHPLHWQQKNDAIKWKTLKWAPNKRAKHCQFCIQPQKLHSENLTFRRTCSPIKINEHFSAIGNNFSGRALANPSLQMISLFRGKHLQGDALHKRTFHSSNLRQTCHLSERNLAADAWSPAGGSESGQLRWWTAEVSRRFGVEPKLFL